MNKITIKPFYKSELAASGTITFETIDLAKLSNEYKLSLQINASGDGTATIDILASNDGVTFVDTATDVLAGIVKGGGPGTDGKYAPIIITTSMLKYCRFFQLRATETGTTDTITLDLYLFVQ
jgi:hypothetical protein